jgi:anti-repressor protein
MNALSSFQNKDFQSMTVWIDEQGREFFRAIDVCSNLRHSNPTQALTRHVNPKYIIQINDGTNRAGETNYLSEPGLYQLIFASKTDWAIKFQEWIFEDVLPYSNPPEKSTIPKC